MKRLAALVFALGTSAFASNALAADLKSPIYKAPPLVSPSWTGFYVGGNVGVAVLDKTTMSYIDFANTGNTFNAYATAAVDEGATAAFGGLHAGYNWQVSPKWVAGIEGDWDWTGLKAGGTTRLNRAVVGTLLTDFTSLENKVDWLASIRGRGGYLWNPDLLLYGTAGVAFAHTKHANAVYCTNVAPSLCVGGTQSIQSSFEKTRVGAALGAGFEYKFLKNWVVGLEYMYYAFGKSAQGGGSWAFANGAPAPFFNCGTPGQNCALFTYDPMELHTGRARLSYKFD
jgi:outer membrane immunogenic protein